MTTFSQSDLYVPVLRALNVNPGSHFSSTELAGAICIVLGVQLDCMGLKDGRPHLLVPMGNAVWQLKDRGLIDSPRRGLHQITPAGIAWLANGGGALPVKPATPVTPASVAPPAPVAAEPDPAPVAPPEPVAPPAPPESVEAIAERLAEAEEAPPAAKPAKRTKTAKLSVVPADDAPAWVRDNYLRGLVASNTPCFGQYSPKAEACGGCALIPWCRNAQAAALSVLASKLVEAEAAKVSAATAALHTETANALSPSAPRSSVVNPPRQIPVQYDGVCARTGSPLKAGSTGYYIPGEGVCSEGSLTAEESAATATEGWGKP